MADPLDDAIRRVRDRESDAIVASTELARQQQMIVERLSPAVAQLREACREFVSRMPVQSRGPIANGVGFASVVGWYWSYNEHGGGGRYEPGLDVDTSGQILRYGQPVAALDLSLALTSWGMLDPAVWTNDVVARLDDAEVQAQANVIAAIDRLAVILLQRSGG